MKIEKGSGNMLSNERCFMGQRVHAGMKKKLMAAFKAAISFLVRDEVFT